jgi:hypothetical protein
VLARSAPGNGQSPRFSMRRSMSYARVGQSLQIVDRTSAPYSAAPVPTFPPQVRTIPAAMQTWRRPDSVLKSACRLRISTPRFLRSRIFRWLHHIHAKRRLSAKQATAPRPCRDGPRDHRYSSGVTANESPAEHCNHESSGPSSVLAPKRNPSQVPSFTGFGIPTRLNWPAPTSAYTRL